MCRPEEIVIIFLLQHENFIRYLNVFLIGFPLANVCVNSLAETEPQLVYSHLCPLSAGA